MSITTREPVAIAGAIQGQISAVIALALLFGWVDWSTEQVGGILAVYTALVAVIAAVTRSKVTPTATL